MNKNTVIIIGVVIVALILGALYVSKNTENEAVVTKDTGDQKLTQDKIINKESEIKEQEAIQEKGAPETDGLIKAGSYEAYSADKIARAETGDVVLFFHASWCPSCRGLNKSIENNLGSIPAGVTILKTDYDKETALKQKYGVTYQHTLVQVDKDGNMIKKWSGSPSLDKLLAQIQ